MVLLLFSIVVCFLCYFSFFQQPFFQLLVGLLRKFCIHLIFPLGFVIHFNNNNTLLKSKNNANNNNNNDCDW